MPSIDKLNQEDKLS